MPCLDGMPSDDELLGIQYPGRQERISEPCVEEMDVLAAGSAASLSPFLGRPLVLFRAQHGGRGGFEIACRLERDYGFTPVKRFVSAMAAPPAGEGCGATTTQRSWTRSRINAGDAGPLDDPASEDEIASIRADFRLLEAHRPQSVGTTGAPTT
jgi:pyochelin biosynthetic protein PchC